MNEYKEKRNVEVFVTYPNSPGERQKRRVLSNIFFKLKIFVSTVTGTLP